MNMYDFSRVSLVIVLGFQSFILFPWFSAFNRLQSEFSF